MADDALFDKDAAPAVNVNEDGSVTIGTATYKNPEEVYKGKANADMQIAKTEAENADLRQQLEERSKENQTALSALMERFDKAEKKKEESNTDFGYDGYKPNENRQDSPKMTREDLNKMVEDTATKLMRKAQEETSAEAALHKLKENKQLVRDGLAKELGSEEAAIAAFEKYRQSEDYDQYVYDRLLQTKPSKLVKDIVGAKPPVASFGPGFKSSSVPAGAGPGGSIGRRKGWDAHKKVMMETPHVYYTPEYQKQMKEDKASFGKDNIDFFSR